jgi:lipoate-protein ligase A
MDAVRDTGLHVIFHDEPTAAGQMACDERLAAEGMPTLRLFRWERPALSFGYRQQPPGWIDPSRCAAWGVELVERPTGGGLAVHGTDLSCSMVVPRRSGRSLRGDMAALCERFAQRCRLFDVMVEWDVETRRASPLRYCLTEPSPYALMVGRRKLGGFAVRAYAASWLIQGSLLVRPLAEAIRRVMPRSVQFDYETRAICLEEAAGSVIDDAGLIDAMRYL